MSGDESRAEGESLEYAEYAEYAEEALSSGTRRRDGAYERIPFWLRLRLSRLEREALRLSLEGMSDVAIAAEVGGSPRLIARRLADAYRKLGLSSRLELHQMLARHGRFSTD